MGKRTSDFLALAAILSGAGIGLGLTSLRAENGPGVVHDRDESTMRFQVRRGMHAEPGDIRVRTSPGNANVYMWRRTREDAPDRRQLLRVRADVERLRRSQLEGLGARIRVLADSEALLGDSEALAELREGLESLELELGELTIDVQREGEDQRRRRRRRPRRMADRPDGSGN